MSSLVLIVFDASKATSASIALELDAALGLSNWYTIFSNTILIETEETVRTLSEKLQVLHPNMNRICIKFDPNDASGLLPVAISKEIAARRR